MPRGYRKKGTAKPEKYGITFDSVDEVWFYEWCLDAQKSGLIKNFIYHPESVLVFPDYVERKKIVLRKCSYTPDFILEGIGDKLKPLFRESIDKRVWVDVKGAYVGLHGDLKAFVIITKALWHLKKIFINKVIMQELCKKTFVPEEIKYTDKTKQLRTAFKGCKGLAEFLKNKSERKKK